jgi:hypothetical protein
MARSSIRCVVPLLSNSFVIAPLIPAPFARYRSAPCWAGRGSGGQERVRRSESHGEAAGETASHSRLGYLQLPAGESLAPPKELRSAARLISARDVILMIRCQSPRWFRPRLVVLFVFLSLLLVAASVAGEETTRMSYRARPMVTASSLAPCPCDSGGR